MHKAPHTNIERKRASNSHTIMNATTRMGLVSSRLFFSSFHCSLLVSSRLFFIFHFSSLRFSLLFAFLFASLHVSSRLFPSLIASLRFTTLFSSRLVSSFVSSRLFSSLLSSLLFTSLHVSYRFSYRFSFPGVLPPVGGHERHPVQRRDGGGPGQVKECLRKVKAARGRRREVPLHARPEAEPAVLVDVPARRLHG